MGSKHKKEVGVILHKSGASFRLWAPFAKAVAITGSFNEWSETPMESEGDGYWSTIIKNAEAGQEYKYVITTENTKLVKNDPRALQLTTSAGNSVIFNNEFDWEGDNFQPNSLKDQVIYELHVGTFNRVDPATIGTFENAMERLDHLSSLGVTTIELMPIGGMSMDRKWWGYTPYFIYAVETLYGGRYQLMEFVKAAHKHNMAVILDVVYNHLGPGDELDLWQFDGWSENNKGGIYFYNDWRSKTPWGDTRPDYGRTEVRQYILDNVRMWLHDCHLDGLRVDSTLFIRNVEGRDNDPGTDIPEAWTLLQEINSLSHKLKSSALVIAEDNGANEYLTKPASEGGAGFGAQWGVTFPHAIRQALDPVHDQDRNINLVIEELKKVFNSNVFERVIYSDSHDSAANGGARLGEEISPGNSDSLAARCRTLIAASIIFTAPGVPMLLEGQEFMQGGSFNDWQALDWQNAEDHAGIILAHKHLIDLRKNVYGNTAGLLGQCINLIHVDDGNKVIAYHRWDKGGPKDDVMVIVNFSNKLYQEYSLAFPRDGEWIVRFNSTWAGYSKDFKDIDVPNMSVSKGSGSIVLPAQSVIILSQDK